MIEKITTDWKYILEEELKKDYINNLTEFVKFEYENKLIFPKKDDIFNALNFTPYNKVKVVILGQDPYHDNGQAHGLSFSVLPGVAIPKSLKNIYMELHEDIGCEIPNHGYLEKWAKEGVLLLNTVLTVEAHNANSHQKKGWEKLTDKIIELLNEKEEPIVFILWGKPASNKRKMITNHRHLILEAPHPSPLSSYRGFFGSKPFSKANEFLKSNGYEEIDWAIKNIEL